MKKPFLISWASLKTSIINSQKANKAALIRELKEKKGAIA